MRSFPVLVGIIFVLGGSALAQPTPFYEADESQVLVEPATALTLDKALDLVLASNPSLSSARYLAASSDGVVTQAGVIPNPILSVEFEDTNQTSPRPTNKTLIPQL